MGRTQTPTTAQGDSRFRLGVALLAAAALLCASWQRAAAAPAVLVTIPVGAAPTGVGFDPATNRAYVANSMANTVSVINVLTNAVIATIPVGAQPSGVGVHSSVGKVYVANFSDGTVSVISTSSNTVIATIPGLKVAGNPNDGPNDIAVLPALNRAYVGRTVHFGGRINVINTITDTLEPDIAGLGSHPVTLAANPATLKVYVANQLSNTVSVIDATTAGVTATIGGFSGPAGVGVNPTTNRIYVNNNSADSVAVISGATDTLLGPPIPVGDDPIRIGVDPDPMTPRIYAANRTGNSVSIIDGTTATVSATVPGLSTPHGVAVNPATHRAYVSNFNGNSVAVIGEPYAFSGFFAPVDNQPTLNSVSAGQSIPVKFSLGGNQGLAIFAAGSPGLQQITCNTGAPVDAIEETVTAGHSSLSYDPTSDRYTYIWKTERSWRNTCRRLTIVLNDGTARSADFAFK
jgi:YVTN family beta-propeller protein